MGLGPSSGVGGEFSSNLAENIVWRHHSQTQGINMHDRQDRVQHLDPLISAEDSHRKKFPQSEDELLSPTTTLTLHSKPRLRKSYNCSPQRTNEKGWGIFAEENIPIGAKIILEWPTIAFKEYSEETKKEWLSSGRRRSPEAIEADRLRKEFEELSKEQQMDIMSLHNSQGEYNSTLYGIFQTNSFKISAQNRIAGIYVFCSRLNHNCDPNCNFAFSKAQDSEDIKARTITITTRQNIKAGEELTISYVPLRMRLGVRQNILLTNHGFICNCTRCVTEGDKLYDWPVDGEQEVRLRFRPTQFLQPEAGKGQGWDFFTVIKSISTEDGIIQAGKVIMREAPLVALDKDKVRRKNSLLYDQLSKLSDSKRNKYLRLYNWRVGLESPTWKSGPSYEVETTDDERPMGWSNSWTRRQKTLPSNATLFSIWEANSFALNYGMEGVFAFISHLNHSCWPTCRAVWHPERNTLDLVSTKPLRVGEEITICYNYSEIFNFPLARRRQYLKDNYGFECCCCRCSTGLDVLPRLEKLASVKSIINSQLARSLDQSKQESDRFAPGAAPEISGRASRATSWLEEGSWTSINDRTTRTKKQSEKSLPDRSNNDESFAENRRPRAELKLRDLTQ